MLSRAGRGGSSLRTSREGRGRTSLPCRIFTTLTDSTRLGVRPFFLPPFLFQADRGTFLQSTSSTSATASRSSPFTSTPSRDLPPRRRFSRSSRRLPSSYVSSSSHFHLYTHSLPSPQFVLPSNPLFTGSQLSVQEASYAYAGWIFAQHFLNRLGPSYTALKGVLDESDSVQAGILSDIRARFRQETFTRGSILEVLQQYTDIVRSSSPHPSLSLSLRLPGPPSRLLNSL